MTDRRCETCEWWEEIVRNRKGLCTDVPYLHRATRPTDTCDQWAEKEKRDGDKE